MSLRGLILTGVFLALIAQQSEAAKPLPDHLNVNKYEAIYKQARERSGEARDRANNSRLQVEQLAGEISDRQRDIENSQQSIYENENEITRLRRDIPRIEDDIYSAEQLISRMVSDIKDKEYRLAEIRTRAKRLKRKRSHLEDERHVIADEINNIRPRYKKIKAKYNEKSKELTRLQNQKAATKQSIRDSQSKIEKNKKDIQTLKQSIPLMKSEITRLKQKVSELKSNMAPLKASLKETETKVHAQQANVKRALNKKSQKEKRVQELKPQMSQVQKKMAQVQKKINVAQSKVNASKAKVEQSKKLVSNSQRNIDAKTAEIAVLKERLDNFDSKTQQMQKNLRAFNVTLKKHRNEFDSLKKKKNKTEAEKKRVGELLREIVQLNQKIANVKKRINQRGQNKSKLQAQLKKLNSQLAPMKSFLERFKTTLALRQKELSAAESVLNNEKENLQAVKRESRGVLVQFKKAKSELLQATESYRTAQSLLDQLNSRVLTINAQIASTNSQISKSRAAIESKEAKITQTQAMIPKLKSEIQSLKQRLAELNGQLTTLEAQVIIVKSEEQQLSRRLAALQVKVDEIKSRLHLKDKDIRALEQKLDRVRRNRKVVKEEILDLDDKISYKYEQVDSMKEAIIQNRSEMSSLARDNSSLYQKITYDKELLRGQEAELAQVKNEYYERESTAKNLEGKTQLAKNKLDEVSDRFFALADAASDFGSREGENSGTPKGSHEGERVGDPAGAQQGRIKGEAEGLIFGFNKGKEVGFSEGQSKGYQKGLNAPENFDRGYSLGLISGKKAALDEAVAISRPKGYKVKMQELLSQLPARSTSFPNTLVNTRGVLMSSLGGVSGSSDFQKPLAYINNTSIPLNLEFSSFEASGAEQACAEEKPSSVAKQVLSRSSVCKYEYSEVNEYCINAYEDSYERAYASSYSKSYNQAYMQACVPSYEVAFSENETVRYDKGYQTTYLPTFREYEAIGAKEAQAGGFKKGKVKAFNDNIEAFRSEQYTLGEISAVNELKTSPVVRLKDVEFVKVTEGHKGHFVPGDTIKLNATIVNYGEVATEPGQVKVKIIPVSTNVEVLEGAEWVDVVGLDGVTVSKVLNIKMVKIKKVGTLSPIVIKVQMLRGDSLIDEKQVQYSMEPHVVSTLSKTKGYTPTPKVNWTQRLKFYFKNSSNQNPKENLNVTLSTKDIPADWIDFKKNNQVINSSKFGPGKTQKVKLYYKILNKKAKGKEIKLVITVKYKGNISFQKYITIKPR